MYEDWVRSELLSVYELVYNCTDRFYSLYGVQEL